ncbi:MAG: ATP-grasp domain-containing protein [Methanoregula sp.]
MRGKVLVAGFATRHIAQSAARAGYDVCAVDHFCDQDLAWYTSDRLSFQELEELPDAMSRMAARHAFDFLIVTSGAEETSSPVPLCGTSRETVKRFLDKLDIQHFFEDIPVPVPQLVPEGTFPVMVKPRRGAGGWRNAGIHNTDELAVWKSLYPDVPYISQELIDGIPASVCCVTDGTVARAVAANEQILRGKGASAYGFSGSVTPVEHPDTARMLALAEQIAAASGCKGTIGIDFVLGPHGPYAIEVNPRFQGTVDTVEAAYECNLFEYHVNACRGVLPGQKKPARFAARSILFADKDLTLLADLKKLAPKVADIPWPGTSFEKDQAIVSVYGSGASRDEALSVLDKNISTVRQYMQ